MSAAVVVVGVVGGGVIFFVLVWFVKFFHFLVFKIIYSNCFGVGD
jgi:hypothetical protein